MMVPSRGLGHYTARRLRLRDVTVTIRRGHCRMIVAVIRRGHCLIIPNYSFHWISLIILIIPF